MKYEFHPDARLEYLDAVSFFEKRRRGLGALFMEEIHTALTFIAEFPKRNRIEVQPNIRVHVNTRFPYQIFYREIKVDLIQILAVAHTSRRPKYWNYRL